MRFFAVGAVKLAQPVEDRLGTGRWDLQYRPVTDAFIFHELATIGASRIQAYIHDAGCLLWREAFAPIPGVAFRTASRLGRFIRVRVGFDRTLGGWRRRTEETLILFLVAIAQLRLEPGVLFQQSIDPALFFQAAFANGVRFHAGSESEARSRGGAA